MTPIEIPSRVQHNDAVTFFQNRLDAEARTFNYHDVCDPYVMSHRRELLTKLREKTSFFDKGKQLFGQLAFGSGLARRTKENGRLDWALIAPQPNRLGENRVLPRERWRERWHSVDYPAIAGRLIDGIAPIDTVSVKHGRFAAEVFMYGGASGYFKGQVNMIRDNVRIKSHAGSLDVRATSTSREYMLLSVGAGRSYSRQDLAASRFALFGDFGALVHDHMGKVVGMLHGGNHAAERIQPLFGYISDMTAIVADIEAPGYDVALPRERRS